MDRGYDEIDFRLMETSLSWVMMRDIYMGGVFNIPAEEYLESHEDVLGVQGLGQEKLDTLIENGANVNVRGTNETTPLHNAVKADYIYGIHVLCNNGANVNARDNRGNLPIHYTSYGNGKSASILIENGANVNVNNNNLSTPVYIAIDFENDKVVDVLLKNGANISKKNFDGLNALMFSVTKDFQDRNAGINILRMLLEHPDTDINELEVIDTSAGHEGYTLLYMAVSHNYVDKVRLLVDMGAKVNPERGNLGITPLRKAINEGFVDIVEILLENGAIVERGTLPETYTERGINTWMEFWEQSRSINPDILRMLHTHESKKRRAKTLTNYVTRNQKQDIPDDMTNEIKSYYGGSNEGERLIAEILNQDLEEVNKILRESSNTNELVNYQNSNGFTPLFFAFKDFENQHDELHINFLENAYVPYSYLLVHNIINALLRYDVNPNLAPNNGWGNADGDISALSPLHQACYFNLVPLVNSLLEKGANPNVVDIDGDTPLHLCMNNFWQVNGSSLEIISILVTVGTSSIKADVNQQNNKQETPLYAAAFHGCSEAVHDLLVYKASPDIPSHRGRTPLLIALKCWHNNAINPSIMRTQYNQVIFNLLNNSEGNSANPNLESSVMGSIRMPLYQACKTGNGHATQYLISAGAKVNVQIPHLVYNTPLLIAIRNSYPWIVRMLLENGANLDLKTGMGGNQDAIAVATQQANNHVTHATWEVEHTIRTHLRKREEERKLLEDMRNSPDGRKYPDDIYGEIRSHFGGKGHKLKYHYKQNGGADEIDDNLQNELFHAIQNRDNTRVNEILEITNSHYINSRNIDGDTPLIIASRSINDNAAIVATLISRGADPNLAPLNGWGDDSGVITSLSPLHQTCYYKLTELCSLLLQHGANPNVRDNDGDTPLHLCMMSTCEGVTNGNLVRTLIAYNANVNDLNDDYESPLKYAVLYHCTEGVRVLLQNGASPNAIDREGNTILNAAFKLGITMNDNINVIKLLLQYGADPNLRDVTYGENSKITPIFTAITTGNEEGLRLLIQKGARINIICKEQIYIGPVNTINDTPLLTAIQHGRPEMVRMLLENGANPDLDTPNNITAIKLVRDFNNDIANRSEIEKILLDYYAQQAYEKAKVSQIIGLRNITEDMSDEIKTNLGGNRKRKSVKLKYIGGMENPNTNDKTYDSDGERTVAVEARVDSSDTEAITDTESITDTEIVSTDSDNNAETSEFIEAMRQLDRLAISNDESSRNLVNQRRREIIERFGDRAIMWLGHLPSEEEEYIPEPDTPDEENEN
tara:strand:- start:2939 stop:6778 length:3840 start_codon:yes stop_codon:yes gene_type:complete